ncbi:MAG: hypothetical protein VB934_21465 [Polyangiaceae bacterium]
MKVHDPIAGEGKDIDLSDAIPKQHLGDHRVVELPMGELDAVETQTHLCGVCIWGAGQSQDAITGPVVVTTVGVDGTHGRERGGPGEAAQPQIACSLHQERGLSDSSLQVKRFASLEYTLTESL